MLLVSACTGGAAAASEPGRKSTRPPVSGHNAVVGQVRTEVRRRRRPRWVRRNPGLLPLYRIGIAVLGGLVLVVGVLLIPYPGPGWLIVFAGLAILAAEFHWARRVLHFLRRRYEAWSHWLSRRHPLVRLAAYAITGLVVLATLWLLNVFALVGGWFGLDWPWLTSPFFT